MAVIRVGISGWTYAPWRGIFYPPKLSQKKELQFASRRVTSIEINGTFYRTQKVESFRQWYAETPADFSFAIKASNYITHRRRLKDVQEPLANFFASGLLALGEKLGPILWQLPPTLPHVDTRVEDFMAMLPHTAQAAAALAARHDSMMEGRAWFDVQGDFPVRHALEVRHDSYRDPDFVAAARRHRVALVIADSGEHSLEADDVTADHVYLRMHGQAPEFAENGYTEEALQHAAARIRAWAGGGEPADAKRLLTDPAPAPVQLVSVYFDNDAKALAPQNAQRLLAILGLAPSE